MKDNRITTEQYREACGIIARFNDQLEDDLYELRSAEERLMQSRTQVMCVSTYNGHNLTWFTKGKVYDMITNPRKRGSGAEHRNKYIFAVIDDNGKKREQYYANSCGVWKFL